MNKRRNKIVLPLLLLQFVFISVSLKGPLDSKTELRRHFGKCNYFIEFLQTTKGGKKFKGRNYSRKSDLMEIHDVLEYMQGLRNHCSPLQRISTPCVSSYKQCSLSLYSLTQKRSNERLEMGCNHQIGIRNASIMDL